MKNKRKKKMKLKVRGKRIEQKNCGNAHRKYAIRGFNQHMSSSVDVNVVHVLFFGLLIRLLFENKHEKKMKLKVSGELVEQKKGGNAGRKYAIRVSNGTYPQMFLLMLLFFLFCFCGDCFNKNGTPKFLTHKGYANL